MEFLWRTDQATIDTFQTDCPIIGETMMRSSTDFPQVPVTMKVQFRKMYGAIGSFEAVLRSGLADRSSSTIHTGIHGLTIKKRADSGTQLC